MSQPSFPKIDPPLTRDDVINQVISSIAMEELGLSHIINAEGEKIQYALGTIEGVTGPTEPTGIEDLLKLNKSVRDTLNTATQNQIFLKGKLQTALSASNMQGATGPMGPTGPERPFLSSYIEALGNPQTVNGRADVVFDTVDNVGNNIEFTSPGTTFTVHQTGLYIVEWSVNLASDNTNKAEFCLLQNGSPTSAVASSAITGNLSAGALINITSVPYTISLNNNSDANNILEGYTNKNSAASIRIARFAAGAS